MSSHTLDRIIKSNSKDDKALDSKRCDSKATKSETNWYGIAIAVVALLILAGFAYYFFYYRSEPAPAEECILDEMKRLAIKNRGVPRTYAEGTTCMEDFREYSRTHNTCEL